MACPRGDGSFNSRVIVGRALLTICCRLYVVQGRAARTRVREETLSEMAKEWALFGRHGRVRCSSSPPSPLLVPGEDDFLKLK